MTRIVSGFAGSLTLRVPKSGTRPTSDHVREAMFSALDARGVIDGAQVLDLYAGSGALGLEAASRGASEVVLVERGAPAAAVCRQNAKAVSNAAPQKLVIDVAARSVQSYLDSAVGAFDLVFLDPPYDLPEGELSSNLTALVPLLADDALVVVERSSRSPEPTWPLGLLPVRSKKYGETLVWWAEPAEG
ncbi:16S rRNA (guanine966-N2)-methyltransferase [Okibacterium sp. HSC-33S16]|uniref:16S rRNA (guanine(966)-N(2))-methyltransferase RsmD n=1 Tax=Okibacterium sp. HSC-33S16 TaxID=2910965 RepID=UPI00209D4295|nr:16S rRNA (guanine(966)-N(2))-methyltransferase RsmD [Okibacterium sp. HSC-33S16]MCP2030537.1 16S rRNA (guanine966-N2)-methyltransferase [Okibacterium sp. HSC-33S16]